MAGVGHDFGLLEGFDKLGDPTSPALKLASLDGTDEAAAPPPSLSVAAPPPAERPLFAPAPAPVAPSTPARPPARSSVFSPPSEDEEAPLELDTPPPRPKSSGRLSTPLPTPGGTLPPLPPVRASGAQAAAAPPVPVEPLPAPMGGTLAPDPAAPLPAPPRRSGGTAAARTSLRDRLAALEDRPGLRLAVGIGLAVLLGFLPAHLYASGAETKKFDAIRKDVALEQSGDLSLEQWNALGPMRREARARMKSARNAIAVTSFLIWMMCAGGIGYVYFWKLVPARE